MDQKLFRHIERLVEDPSFRAWCVNKASAEKSRYWDYWIAENNYQKQVGEIARKIVLELEQAHAPLPSSEKFRAWEKIRTRIRESDVHHLPRRKLPDRKSYRGWTVTAAAVIFLLLISFTTVNYTHWGSLPGEEQPEVPESLTKATAYGEHKVIMLDSGTRIILNANSSLTHLDGWVFNNKVQVKLEGEAYFDVTKRTSDADPAFEVKTSDGNVSVMGTRFVVSTWDNETRVVLEEGRVAIDKASRNNDFRNAILSSNELAEFSRSSEQISIDRVNPRVYTSWVRGILMFDRTPLVEVARRIENTFGVDVVIADPALLTRKVSGSVENKNVNVVVSAISKTLQIPVAQADKQVIFGNSLFVPALYNQPANLNGSRDE